MIWIKGTTGWVLDTGNLYIIIEKYDNWSMSCSDIGIPHKMLPVPADATSEQAQAAAIHIVKQRVLGILQVLL